MHHIYRSDDDRFPHCHPWDFTSLILSNGYVDEHWGFTYDDNREPWWKLDTDRRHLAPLEHTRSGWRIGPFYETTKPLRIYKREAEHIHRVQLHPGKTAWTLVFTGKIRKPWHFYDQGTRIFWRKFLNEWDERVVD